MPGGKGGTFPHLAIKEENHYYPFGLQHSNYNVDYLEYQQIGGDVLLYPPLNANEKLRYNYKYQEQERQDELGLNWDSFKWRNYDYAIGRFMSIDPLAEDYAYQTTYQFSSNQPVHAPEIEGLESRNDLNLRQTATTQNDAIPNRNSQISRTVQLARSSPASRQASVREQPVLSQGSTPAQQKINRAKAASIERAKNIIENHDNLGSPYTQSSVMTGAAYGAVDYVSGAAAGKAVNGFFKFIRGNSTTAISLGSRASEIHQAVPKPTQTRTTIAVAEATDASGNSINIVGSSEARLRPAQRSLLNANEIEAMGAGHAEATILNFAQKNGYNVSNIGASRPICPTCADQISSAGVQPVTPLKPK